MPVVEVVPADPGDPRGAGFAAGCLPFALTSVLAGYALLGLVLLLVGRSRASGAVDPAERRRSAEITD